jgi:probable rRNA maturation factor
MKEAILGIKYELSLTFVGETRAQSLNKQYRNKEYVPNVLSFPLDTQAGEIYITPKVAEKEAHKFSLSPKGYIGYLFIHGLLHLKGYPHGATMDRLEKKYCALYKLK